MTIVETQRFRKSYEKLPKNIKEKAKKQFKFFLEDMFYPSLHTEKLAPHNKNIWSFRIDRNYRVIFTFMPRRDECWIIDIGPHDIYKN